MFADPVIVLISSWVKGILDCAPFWITKVRLKMGEHSMQSYRIESGIIPEISKYPFSFLYDNRSSNDLLDMWKYKYVKEEIDPDRTKLISTWVNDVSGLKVDFEAIRYSDFPALDWVIYLENFGGKETPIISKLKALDVIFESPLGQMGDYILHRTKGAPADVTDFEVEILSIRDRLSLSALGGRSSNKDLPFFKLETGDGSYIFAVGWSGQWKADFERMDGKLLRVTIGMEDTNFILYPGERVRTPRILILFWNGDTLESNAQFRQLIYKHYTATRGGRKILPVLFCNTCFTRGGGWLNECNAENQISLIKAYAPLKIEALVTDAGWFDGGWPSGAGNWTPRRDAYPEGMEPVAKAADDHGMVYGLWFEPERVVSGTSIHKEHPDWLLSCGTEPQSTYLLNFGLPEVQDYMFNVIKKFMDIPGFGFYRQDFNMDPLPYWRFNDAPNRQGITEMKYIEGLYAFWDRIAKAYPNSIREGCASGGRRIDLETISRMHIHQKTDYWFDNEVDQASIWGLSQYLPNNVFVAHLNKMDYYSFHSTMASSLCLGWIADDPNFDIARAKELVETYKKIRHLLIGAWYPLTPCSREKSTWIASQYHRPDLQEGFILVFRRELSEVESMELKLHGLEENSDYEVTYETLGERRISKGSTLMKGLIVSVSTTHRSELITYRKL